MPTLKPIIISQDVWPSSTKLPSPQVSDTVAGYRHSEALLRAWNNSSCGMALRGIPSRYKLRHALIWLFALAAVVVLVSIASGATPADPNGNPTQKEMKMVPTEPVKTISAEHNLGTSVPQEKSQPVVAERKPTAEGSTAAATTTVVNTVLEQVPPPFMPPTLNSSAITQSGNGSTAGTITPPRTRSVPRRSKPLTVILTPQATATTGVSGGDSRSVNTVETNQSPKQNAVTEAAPQNQTGGAAVTASKPSPDPMSSELSSKLLLAVAGAIGGMAGGIAFSRRRDLQPAVAEKSKTEPLTSLPPSTKFTPVLSGLAYVEPDALLQMMMRIYADHRISYLPPHSALSSMAGNNPENQDYLLSFEFQHRTKGQISATIIADGCGGHDGGALASYTAVSACVQGLLQSAETTLQGLAQDGFEKAIEHVERVGQKLWGPNDFRSTLIVVLADQTQYVLQHLGDGGGVLRRSDGSWEQLLIPQREEKTGYLTGSLGPMTYGQARMVSVKRQAGDFLACGTDGLFVDEINDMEKFWGWLLKQAVTAKNVTLQEALNMLLGKCLSTMPDIFDDNISGALIVTPFTASKSELHSV